MTREETKELIAENRTAVMQAYVDGKQIQFFNEYTREWEDIPAPNWLRDTSYRVKSETKCRPFKNVDECWREMLKHEPFGWLREKGRNVRTQIGFIHTEGIQGTSGGSSNYKAFFDCFSFADGTPFGILEEE